MEIYICIYTEKTVCINANSIMCIYMCMYTYLVFGNMCFMHRFVCLTRVDA